MDIASAVAFEKGPARAGCTLSFRNPLDGLTRLLLATFCAALFLRQLLGWIIALNRGPHRVALFMVAWVLRPIALLLLAWVTYLAISGLLQRSLVAYYLDDRGLLKTTPGRTQHVAWPDVSSFSETEPAHREGDRFCRLKNQSGEPLMRVGAHLLGSNGPGLLAEIRARIGAPSLPADGSPEAFRFADFGDTPPYHVELTETDLAAKSEADEVRVALDEIEAIRVRAWPEVGAGRERARAIAGERMVELDSRIIGFWPLMDYLVAHAPRATVEDASRRSRLRGRPPRPTLGRG